MHAADGNREVQTTSRQLSPAGAGRKFSESPVNLELSPPLTSHSHPVKGVEIGENERSPESD